MLHRHITARYSPGVPEEYQDAAFHAQLGALNDRLAHLLEKLRASPLDPEGETASEILKKPGIAAIYNDEPLYRLANDLVALESLGVVSGNRFTLEETYDEDFGIKNTTVRPGRDQYGTIHWMTATVTGPVDPEVPGGKFPGLPYKTARNFFQGYGVEIPAY
jgi:hypothetical protein